MRVNRGHCAVLAATLYVLNLFVLYRMGNISGNVLLSGGALVLFFS
ncbi:hypothetical protein ACFS07_04155 [Undibacterium arcticum]